MKRLVVTSFLAFIIGMGVVGGAVAQHMHDSPMPSPMAGHHHDDSADMSMGAAYLTITNTGTTPDRLTGVKTDVATAAEVHEVTMENDVMSMTPLLDGLEIPAGESVTLKPASEHIMLIGLTRSLLAGENYELTLTFEHAGEVTLTVPIVRSEPKDDDATGEKVTVGDLEISGAWSRQAPMIGGGMASPAASPEATPAH